MASSSPPPGRQRLAIDEVEQHFVTDSVFADSSTRAMVWAGFTAYLAQFVKVEDTHAATLGGRSLLTHVWLGGSFISAKRDPRNIDASVFINLEAHQLIKGLPHTAWMTKAFHREHALESYRVSPLRVGYLPVASPFNLNGASRDVLNYFQARGKWDDWWQRLRDPSTPDEPPSTATSAPRRGYVEVTL